MRGSTVHSKEGGFHKHAEWLHNHLSDRKLLFLLSFFVGVFTALAAYILKWLIEEISNFLFDDFDVDNTHWLLLVFPVIGILITSLFIKYVVRDDIGHGVTKILFAISRRQGRIKSHNCWSSIIASSITIGFGGSVGAESPIVLTGSAIGSSLGKIFHVDQKTLMILIGCGAAGAIAGVFKAPFAGLLFTLEVLMLDLTMSSLLPLLISCITASLLTNAMSGSAVLFTYQPTIYTIERVPSTIFLGIFCGVLSLYFTKATNYMEDVFKRIGNMYTKFIAGGIILSMLIFLFPPLYGEGYDAINIILNGNPADLLNNSIFENKSQMLIPMLGLIMLTKVFATTATTSAGGCGGLFAPSLFLGCVSGFVFANLWNNAGILSQVSPQNYALLGMAGVMTGIMHSPLTSVFLIAELTGGYNMLVPLLIITVSSYLTIYTFEPHSIYARRLAQKGELITHHKDHAILTLMTLEPFINKNCPRIAPDEKLSKLVTYFAREKADVFAVVDGLGTLRGIINLANIRKVIFRQELYHVLTTTQLMEEPQGVVYIDEPMTTVMERFEKTEASVLPVLDQSNKFVGFIYKTQLYSAYRQMLVDLSED
ncbi:MAG: chloride channel protein [Bacteroidaceae bacterium]|jgi:CIC family chloride channel protein|nr:chloride channel protein [Bacteroidaceae bacterium]HAE24935.1 chloride channel protein [Prevotellaceae bacterium]